MTSTQENIVAAKQITSNDETFTIGSYMGFEIMIRDKDGYVNATKLLQLINEKENTNKLLKNIIRLPMYKDYKQFLIECGVGSDMSHQKLDYQLDNNFNN
jgi:hypothetical protein